MRAAACADRSIELGTVVRPHGDLAAVAARHCVSVDRGIAIYIGTRCALLGASAMEIAADQHGAAACIARYIDAGTAEEAGVLAEYLNGAADSAGVEADCLECAAVADDACGAAIEDDFAVARDERVGADDAAVVDDSVEERIRAARGEEHAAAVGLDRAGVDGG